MKKCLVLAVVFAVTASAQAAVVEFGKVDNFNNADLLCRTGTEIYAVNSGGGDCSGCGINWKGETVAGSPNNGDNVGTCEAPGISGFYPSMNSLKTGWCDRGLGATMGDIIDTGREDSGNSYERIAQFNVTADHYYRVQYIGNHNSTGGRSGDLSVGAGLTGTISGATRQAWASANLAVNDMQVGSQASIWKGVAYVPTGNTKLWVAGLHDDDNSNGGDDGNGTVAAMLVQDLGASPTTVYAGSWKNFTGAGDIDETGTIQYAINVGGNANKTPGSVTYDRDDGAANQGDNVGTNASDYTAGYYPALNTVSTSGNPDHQVTGTWAEITDSHRADSEAAQHRLIQFDVPQWHYWRVQIIFSGGSDDLKFCDVSVGPGLMGTIDNDTRTAWKDDNLVVDNMPGGNNDDHANEVPGTIWDTGTGDDKIAISGTNTKLWIGIGRASSVGGNPTMDGVGVNTNPDVVAILITDLGLIPEPATLAIIGLGGLTLLARRRRRRI